jgi:hypothetical protein
MFRLSNLLLLGLSGNFVNLLDEIESRVGLDIILTFQNASQLQLPDSEEYVRLLCRDRDAAGYLASWINYHWTFDPRRPDVPMAFESGCLENHGITVRCCDRTERKGE